MHMREPEDLDRMQTHYIRIPQSNRRSLIIRIDLSDDSISDLESTEFVDSRTPRDHRKTSEVPLNEVELEENTREDALLDDIYEQIANYHKQARLIFHVKMAATILGFLLIVIGVILLVLGHTNAGVVGTAIGWVMDIISRVFDRWSDVIHKRINDLRDEL